MENKDVTKSELDIAKNNLLHSIMGGLSEFEIAQAVNECQALFKNHKCEPVERVNWMLQKILNSQESVKEKSNNYTSAVNGYIATMIKKGDDGRIDEIDEKIKRLQAELATKKSIKQLEPNDEEEEEVSFDTAVAEVMGKRQPVPQE